MDTLFRRPAFHRYTEQPAWHLAIDVESSKKHTLFAKCGYEYDNIFEDARIRKSKTKPPRRDLCARCFPEAAQKRKQKNTMAGIDLAQFTTSPQSLVPSDGFSRPKDDTYEYEITKVGVDKYKNGKNAGKQYIFIDYRLGNGQSHRDMYTLPVVFGQETDQERQALQRYLKRLVDLGVPAESVNSFTDTDSLVGWRGVMDLVTTKNNNGEFQNARNFRAGARLTAPASAPQVSPAQPVGAVTPAQPSQPVQQAQAAAPGAPSENPFG